MPIIRILKLVIDEAALANLSDRQCNQLFGCMNAHNELSVLNRILLFTMNTTSKGELHDATQQMQMWCMLQLLAGKLFETWDLLRKSVLLAKPEDPLIGSLSSKHKASLSRLRDYLNSCLTSL